MQKALELLTELTKLLPVPGPPRHHLTVQVDYLVLTVWHNEQWYQFRLEDSDFDSDPAELAKAIAESVQ